MGKGRLNLAFAALLGLLPVATAADLVMLPDEGDGDYTVLLEVAPPSEWPADAALRLAFDYRSDEEHHAARLTKDGIRLEEVIGGQAQPLGAAGAWPVPAGDETVEVTVKRRAWLIEVAVNGRVAAWGHDEQPYGGRIGIELTNLGLSPDDILVQPTVPPHFTDDFMRTPDDDSPWDATTGDWALVGISGGKGDLRADLSANPFSIRCQESGLALARAGDWFWDSYSCAVAAKSATGGGELGLAFYVVDDRNYYLLSLAESGSGDARPVKLLKVVDGKESILTASLGGYEVDIWHRLEARVSDGLIEGLVDGRVVVTAADRTFGQGGIGCWGRDAVCWFDDAEVTPWWGFSDPLRGADLSSWVQAGGHWNAVDGALRVSSSFEKPGTIMTGASHWRDYEVSADVTIGDGEGAGLYACGDGVNSWYLFRWADGDPVGSWQLFRMAKGKPASLGIVPADIDRSKPQQMSLSAAGGLIDCRVDDESIITVADSMLTGGRAGLRAEGGTKVSFSNLAVRSVREGFQPLTFTKQFTQEDTMADWARPSSDWPRDPETGLRWFRLPFFNDLSLRFPYRVTDGSSCTVLMGTVAYEDAGSPASAGTESTGLQIELAVHGTTLGVTCRRGREVVAQADVPGGATGLARVDKSGPTLRVWVDDELVLGCNDDTWLDNSALGVLADSAVINPNQLEVYSTHMPDYTFSGAPTEWRPTLGLWQVTDRWSCFPGWAWFGGTKHQSPLVWSKRRFHGDQTFEFWAGLEMDTEPRYGGYTHPSDINCTIAGDGQNLCSGYSFVFAGDNNTKTKILRGNQVVAETDKVRFVNPTSRNMNFHRHWFHVKVVKYGPDLYMSVDGKWVLNWRDPQPLSGGHAAIWSYNNGIVVARVRAAAQYID